ncbi:MAG: DUF6398 domain-containing protein [Actinomycetota bacterium]
MSRRRERRSGSPGGWTRPGGRLPPPRKTPRRGEPPELVLHVRRLLDAGEPLPLIAHVSMLVAALDPRGVSPFQERAGRDLPSIQDLARSFTLIEGPEGPALRVLVAALVGDSLLASEARAELGRRGHTLPEWLARLDEVTVHRTLVTSHVFGDAEDIVAGVRLAGGHELTALVHVDHNLGSVATDGFVVSDPVEDVERVIRRATDGDTRIDRLAPAETRARLDQAIEHGAMTFPPFESDTWPAARPAVEWIVRLLPEGGTGYERPEWSEDAARALAERFFASSPGRALDDPDARGLLESILWFGTDYGPGDPMRWSPAAVEILLLDWLPRKIVADTAFLSRAPDVLAAFTRFCHAERGIAAHLTAQTLAAIGELAPEYLEVIRSPRLQGPLAILGAVGAVDPDDPRWHSGGHPDEDLRDVDEILLDALRDAVGGDAALRALDATPLPDEPFDWDGVPEDIHAPVGEVLTHTDACCEALLDTEFRTAARRFLARAARGDPQVFRRRARPETAAAAVVWIIGQANRKLGHRGGVTAKAIAEQVGLRSGAPSQRAETLLRAAGHERRLDGAIHLGSPAFLTSQRRASIIDMRDRLGR